MAQRQADDDKGTDDNHGFKTGTLEFAGTTRFTEADDPPEVWGHGSSMKWWTSERRGKEEAEPIDLPESGLLTRIQQLPTASDTGVRMEHPRTGEAIPTSKNNAVFNPEILESVTTYEDRWGDTKHIGTEDQARSKLRSLIESGDPLEESNSELARIAADTLQEATDDHSVKDVVDAAVDRVVTADDALYHIPTSSYTIWNPREFLEPLAEVIQDEGLEEAVFGEFRVAGHGGEVSADIFFDGKHVQAPNMDADRKPIVTGFQIDWDFLGNVALKAQGMALDFDCVNALRGITDEVKVKHAGRKSRTFTVGDQKADSFREVWEILMEKIDLKTDQLSQIIQEASETTLDFSELPDDFARDYENVWDALYAYLGFPDYLADSTVDNGHASMGDRLRTRANDPYEPTWWDIHSAATWGITNFARGDVSKQSVQNMNRTARDLLMNPAEQEDVVVQGYRQHVEEEEEATLADVGNAEAEIAGAFEAVREKRQVFEERQEEILELTGGA